MLQPRRQRAVLHLDAQELEVFFVVRAGDAVGPQQRLAFDFQADHDEVAVVEPQGRVTRGGEGEQGVVPVVHAQHALSIESSHVVSIMGGSALPGLRPVALRGMVSEPHSKAGKSEKAAVGIRVDPILQGLDDNCSHYSVIRLCRIDGDQAPVTPPYAQLNGGNLPGIVALPFDNHFRYAARPCAQAAGTLAGRPPFPRPLAGVVSCPSVPN